MNRAKRKTQTVYFLIGICMALLMGGFLYKFNPIVAIFWFFGLAIGFVLQRSKFCINAAFRDLIIFQMGGMAKGLLITLLVSTIGFFLVRLWAAGNGLSIPGNFDPIGWHSIFGGVIFGVGMVIAGGCASGTLMRMGEGYLLQWLVFLGLVIGSIVGSYNYSWWSRGQVVLLNNLVGLWPAFIGQLLFIIGLYLVVHWWENRI